MGAKMDTAILRRNDPTKMTPAELAIAGAIKEVQKLGVDVKITAAVLTLSRGQAMVSNYIDLKNAAPKPPRPVRPVSGKPVVKPPVPVPAKK
jgi:hypothetical protein